MTCNRWREAKTYEGIMELLGADIICLQGEQCNSDTLPATRSPSRLS